MTRPERPSARPPVTLLLILAAAQAAPAQEPDRKAEGRLRHVQTVRRPDLAGVVSAVLSPDGKSLYAASFRPGSIDEFARDPETGQIEHRRKIVGPSLAGTTSLELSPDGRAAVATAFRSRTAVLYRRDVGTGGLTEIDVVRHDTGGMQSLVFPIRAAFSTDGQFVYVVDSGGPNVAATRAPGALTAFRVTPDGLNWVENNAGRDGCFANGRGLEVHPDGRTLLVACSTAGTLVLLDRDGRTGKTTIRQVLKDEEGDVHGLAGVMGVAVSPDGRFAYTAAGRFQGDSAVSAFRIDGGGRASVIQEFHDGKDGLSGFRGGNQLIVSPDGRNVYAAATVSGSVACFGRDAESGKLTLLETLPDDDRHGSLAGAVDLAISPDGRFVYVAAEEAGALSVYRRDAGR
jgi:6-phosphogluconolactonase (cycloisomerase 2 family)